MNDEPTFNPDRTEGWAMREIDALSYAAETLADLLRRVAPSALDELDMSEFDASDDLVMSPNQLYRREKLRAIIQHVIEEAAAPPVFSDARVAREALAIRARFAEAHQGMGPAEMADHIEFTVFDSDLEDVASRKLVDDLREEARRCAR